MSKKELFVAEITTAINSGTLQLSDDAISYFNALSIVEEKEKPLFTENGMIILKFMQDNKDAFRNMFKAKDIAEGTGILSRAVSGAARKLFTDGYIEKIGENPVIYVITEKGISANLNVDAE